MSEKDIQNSDDDNVQTDSVIEEDKSLPSNGSSNTKELEQQLLEAKEESRTNLGGWQRSQADFENYKKRKENESQELIIFAREVVIAKLLPTLDSLEQGMKHVPSVIDPDAAAKMDVWKKGVDGAMQQMDKALAEMGVKKIQAVGKQFDPNFHEAVREVAGPEDGLVMEEFQTGYELNGKVIRPSQVSISKKQ